MEHTLDLEERTLYVSCKDKNGFETQSTLTAWWIITGNLAIGATVTIATSVVTNKLLTKSVNCSKVVTS